MHLHTDALEHFMLAKGLTLIPDLSDKLVR